MLYRMWNSKKPRLRNRTWRCQVEGLERRDLLAANPLAAAGAMLGGIGGVGIAGRGGGEAGNGGPVDVAPGQYGEQVQDGTQCNTTVVSGELTVAETESVMHMVNEEKLAHDVYMTLGELWSSTVFERIASSESQHMTAMATICAQHELDNPVEGLERGQFSDPAFTNLYAELVTSGSTSLLSAYRVGAKIEELDIVDLQESFKVVEKSDIVQVYENLLSGSRNHLRSFAHQIEQLDGEYVPEYLTQDAYEAIVDSPYEAGRVDRVLQGYGNRNSNGDTPVGQQQGTGEVVGQRDRDRLRDRIVLREDSVATAKQRSQLREAAKDRLFAQLSLCDRVRCVL
jgi:hypothetical protein